MSTRLYFSEHWVALLRLSFSLAVSFVYLLDQLHIYDNEVPTVNRSFALEPGIFARFRWAFKSQKILNDAYKKYDGQVYRIARGDVDMVVVPTEFIPELNRLPQSMINSRMCHAYSMIGHLNGMNVVLETQLHVKRMLQRISPALPELLKPAIFTAMFVMRLVPVVLQPLIVWLLPAKWRLQRSMKKLEQIVVPEVKRRRLQRSHPVAPDLLSWMVEGAEDEREGDPYMLTKLLAALNSGGTYSSVNFIVSVILDLVAHPNFLEEIREEIREKHAEVNETWDYKAFHSLHKLESAMKETARLSPGSLTTFSRVLLGDYTLSNGILLKKGQFVCVSSYCRSMDPAFITNPETYDALRAYNHDFKDHLARPFKGVYGGEYRWGAGRWACAGRFLATTVAKVILVKLLDEFDFKFTGGHTTPSNSIIHEFLFIHPGTKLMMRRREKTSGIKF